MEFSVHHVAISARDMQASIAFYEGFGFQAAMHYREPDGSFEIAHLKLGATFLEVFWFADQIAAPETAAELRTDLPRIGVKHFALQVESIEAAKTFVEERQLATDIEIRAGVTGVRYFFIKDPSGILLELIEDERNL